MKHRSLFIITILGFTAFAMPGVQAGGKGGNHAPKPVMHTTITSISENSVTVQEAKATKTFTITKDTEIDYNGQRVALSALQPGMRVEISSGMTEGVASRINASEAPKAPVKPAGKK